MTKVVLHSGMRRASLIIVLLAASAGCGGGGDSESVDDDVFSLELFADPPTEFGPQTRWWWPGGAVDDETLRAQLSDLADVGYSAVEIQPFMSGVTNADLAIDDRIRTVGDANFLERLRTAACAARDLGLAWDLTLGSGWSTGTVGIDDDSARQLISAELELTGPSSFSGLLPVPDPPSWIADTNNVLPAIDGFDDELALTALLAAEVIAQSAGEPIVLGDIVELTAQDGMVAWEVPPGTHRVFAIYENRTRHFPAGGAYPGQISDARVIDHLDRRGIDAFLGQEFVNWIDAVADCPPRAVFVDSFELIGELPWTTSFGSRFETSMGYDIEPLLPFLFLNGGESEYVNIVFGRGQPRYRASDQRGARTREDYEQFRSASFIDEFIAPLSTWLQERGIALRLQAHGGYADVLDAYAMSDVPESEGLYGAGSYDFLRLAASAAQIAGKRYVSNETFPTTGAPALTELEARLVIGRAFSAGINRLVHHGNAYPFLDQDGQRWYPFRPREGTAFATGPLDISFDLHPSADVWTMLPGWNRMAARLSYALSRGNAVSEVAWLYPMLEAENFPNFGVMPRARESEVSTALRRAGLSYSRVSRGALAASISRDGALQVRETSFEALVVEGGEAANPEMLQAIERAAEAGVPAIWIGTLPTRADGLVNAAARDAEVEALTERLQSLVTTVTTIDEIPIAIANAGVVPSLGPIDSTGIQASIQRRQVTGGDVYFLFNESFEEHTEELRITGAFDRARLLDLETGESSLAAVEDDVIAVTLPPAGGTVLWLER